MKWVLADFYIPEDLEKKVRREMYEIYRESFRERKESSGSAFTFQPHSSDPKEIAQEIIRVKEIIKAIFNDPES